MSIVAVASGSNFDQAFLYVSRVIVLTSVFSLYVELSNPWRIIAMYKFKKIKETSRMKVNMYAVARKEFPHPIGSSVTVIS